MKSSSPRYLLILTATAILLCGAAATLAYLADPYGIYRYGTRGDWTETRPRIRYLERLHKAHAVAKAKADALLFGNSRVIVGLDPDNPLLPANTYNLGLSAANNYECLRYLQHATTLHRPKLVILALDKGSFSADSLPEPDFAEDRLCVSATGKPQPNWWRNDYADTLFSISAVKDSILTFTARGARVTYPSGFRDETLMKPFLETENLLTQNETWKATADSYLPVDDAGRNSQFDAFRNFLRYCTDRQIEVILFTNPVHAELLDVESGDPEEFATWFKQTAQIVTEENQRQGAKISFWNFYGYNEVTSEAFPSPEEETSRMQFYWEISHYRKTTGDMVLARVFGAYNEQLDDVENFGTKITSANVSEELTRLNNERQRWMQLQSHAPHLKGHRTAHH